MSPDARLLGLPAVALVLVAGVLGVQVASGGGSFEPLRPADACVARPATSLADGIEGLTENLVLIGVNDAACTLGISREALTLELAQSSGPNGAGPTDEQVDAVRSGLLAAVRQMQDDGTLPPVSALLDEVLDQADLNGFVEAAIRALPDSVVDGALKTDDVLARTIEDLDLRELLANIDSQDDLNAQVEAAVTDAVKDSLVARVKGLF